MATKKSSKPAVAKDEKFEGQDFDLFKAIDIVDRKEYDWFSTLNEEQQRKFVPYMMTHWISAVKSKGPVGAYYVMSVDANANKYLLNERIQQHPELQWKMLCASSPGIGKQWHQWIPHLNSKLALLKEQASKKEVKEYFAKVYATTSADTVDEIATELVRQQRHKYRLSKLYPEMKVADIEVLSTLITEEELEQYEKESGN